LEDKVIWADYWLVRPSNLRTDYQPLMLPVIPHPEYHLVYHHLTSLEPLFASERPDAIMVGRSVTFENAITFFNKGYIIYSCAKNKKVSKAPAEELYLLIGR
jgi:hypothetical protein